MKILKPPQAVIYSRDMEPITVIDMIPSYWDHLYRVGFISFSVPRPFTPNFDNEDAGFYLAPLVVRVTASLIRTTNDEGFILLNTEDEATALMMKCGFLPGQRAALNEEKKRAFAKGFMHALSKLGEM